MNNIFKKRISIMLIAVACVCCSFSVGASAQDIRTARIAEKTGSFVQNQEIQPRADVIEIKYRYYNGINQYRRRNRTDNCWVDPYWINC